MCMNESLSALKSVCVCQGEPSSETQRRGPSAFINQTLESDGMDANCTHVQCLWSMYAHIEQIFKVDICVRLVVLKLPPITACY